MSVDITAGITAATAARAIAEILAGLSGVRHVIAEPLKRLNQADAVATDVDLNEVTLDLAVADQPIRFTLECSVLTYGQLRTIEQKVRTLAQAGKFSLTERPTEPAAPIEPPPSLPVPRAAPAVRPRLGRRPKPERVDEDRSFSRPVPLRPVTAGPDESVYDAILRMAVTTSLVFTVEGLIPRLRAAGFTTETVETELNRLAAAGLVVPLASQAVGPADQWHRITRRT